MFEVAIEILKDLIPIAPVYITLILAFNILSDLLFRN